MDPHRKSDGRRKKDNSDKSVVEDLLQNVSQSVDKTLGVESIGQANKEATSSKDIAGDFDIYLFAQVWTPRFCCTKQKQCAEEQHKNDLTVHGLWPARQANSTYPTYCANNNNLPIPSKDKLAIHEWKKHGTYTHSFIHCVLPSHSQHRNVFNTDIRPICERKYKN